MTPTGFAEITKDIVEASCKMLHALATELRHLFGSILAERSRVGKMLEQKLG
jgi:hypothetical protein